MRRTVTSYGEGRESPKEIKTGKIANSGDGEIDSHNEDSIVIAGENAAARAAHGAGRLRKADRSSEPDGSGRSARWRSGGEEVGYGPCDDGGAARCGREGHGFGDVCEVDGGNERLREKGNFFCVRGAGW